MIYVIEGPDRCGKSTFINHIRNNLTNPKQLVIHSSKPPKELTGKALERWTVIYYTQLIENAIAFSKDGYDIILDRSWISEYVYGPLYRNIILPFDMMEHTISENADMFKLCFFKDSPVNLVKREDGESPSNKVADKIKELAAFDSALNLTVIKKQFIFDWVKMPFRKDVLEDSANIVIKS